MNASNQVYAHGSLLVEGDKILAVGVVDEQQIHGDAEVIDLHGKYLLPGFVNTHVHTSQQISRGVGDDVDFITWLHKQMWPFESNMTEKDSYISTLMCCLEQIWAGVTSFAEPGGQVRRWSAYACGRSQVRDRIYSRGLRGADGYASP